MKFRLGGSWVALVLMLGMASATGQALDDHWKRCEDKNPDLRIGGCTAVIQLGQDTTENIAIAFIKRGIAYEWKGDHARAVQDYDQAIRVNPSNADAFYNRGVAYGRLGQPERAIQNYDQAIRLRPSYADAYYNRGVAFKNQGEHERAILEFDQVLRLQPGADDARRVRCDSLKALGRAASC